MNDKQIQALADSIEKGKEALPNTEQAKDQKRTFGQGEYPTQVKARPTPDVKDREETHDAITAKQTENTGIGFDKVLQALHLGKECRRKDWGVGMYLVPGQNGTGKTVGMNFKFVNGSVGRAALHTNDLLATDWEISE